MKECLEEGTIQAYVDGELSPSAAERVATHALACAACAEALSEAENELSLLASAFEPELSLPVPSERLRERLDAAIFKARATESAPRAARRSLKAWLASLAPSFNFAPRHALGFASLVAVVAFAAIFALVVARRDAQPPALAVVSNGRAEMNLNAQIPSGTKTVATQPNGDLNVLPVSSKSSGRQTARRQAAPSRLPKAVNKTDASLVADAKPLPGEGSYLKTIASLSSIIETNGENALKPSLRGEYERNLAVVNHAIDATRRTARRNPKDSDAIDFLYSSYQSKIDLLSAVAEQGQMVAIAR
jgi:anti-sigma-K factor RskA